MKQRTVYRMMIDGESVASGATLDVVNPATGEPFASVPECTPEQLDKAMSAAQRAFGTWKRDEDERRLVLDTAAEALLAETDTLSELITLEQGKPIAEARREVAGAAAWLRYYAKLRVEPEVIQDDAHAKITVVRRPMGTVAAITPWNFPLLLSFWKIAPALAAGNTVVLKPSPYTPVTTLKVGEVLASIIPAGVLNVVSGGDSLGQRMTEHPVPRKISFTGSVATGKRVAQSAAPDLKRVTLELGGNDAAILLDDVDPGAIANDLFWAAFGNCGQVCSGIKRVYVPQSIFGEVAEALLGEAKDVVVGDGRDEATQIGPVQNRPQYERVRELVDDALNSGARAVSGGKAMNSPGYFFEPTILTDVHDGMRIVDEEQFGPVLPLIPYTELSEAVDAANATQFGLGGSVWGKEEDRLNSVAADLECGVVWKNAHKMLGPATPFGGVKWSGMGVENGPWGLYGMTDLQMVWDKR
jgi:acyl-CoA reductase-like NAD-dependent aldehyde dehydrogenase